jgi:hypothetical protein
MDTDAQCQRSCNMGFIDFAVEIAVEIAAGIRDNVIVR